MKPCAMSLVMFSALAFVAAGQPSDSGQPPKDSSKGEGKKPAPSALEEMLAKALKQNPDILVAEAKVHHAEAELNRVRQQVLAKIVALNAEINASKEIVKETGRRLEELRKLSEREPKIITSEEFGNVQVTLLKAKTDLATKEAELQALIGKKFMGGASGVQGMTFTPDGKLILPQEDGSIRIWDPKTGQPVDPLGAPGPTNAAVLRKMLQVRVGVDFDNQPLADVLEYFQRHMEKGSGVNLLLATRDIPRDAPVKAKLAERVPLAAALQYLEDTLGLRFVIRDYGIVGMDRDLVPAGALTVSDFLKRDLDAAQ